MSDQLFIPQNPQTVNLRPLDKGIVRDVSATLVPVGGFWNLVNYVAEPDGLRRRGGLRQVVDGNSDVQGWDLPLVDVAPYWSSAGLRKNLLVGKRGVYQWAPDGSISAEAWSFTPAGAGVGWITSGTNSWLLTDGSEDFVSEGIKAGDVVYAGAAGWAIVTAVATSVLTLQARTEFAPTSGNSYSYTVYKGFDSRSGWAADWANIDGYTVFAGNGLRGLLAYDGSDFGEYNAAQDPAVTNIRTVCSFDNRLWIGGMTESGVRERQRIRWTTKGDLTSFPAANFVNLPYTDSEIVRLVGLGSLMVVYMGTAVFIGRPANYTDTPLYFEHFETGGIGLVGPKAVAEFLDGQFFVGQDDVYFLSGSVAPQAIGNRQLQDDIKGCGNLGAIYACPDPPNSRVLFSIPTVDETRDRVWSYCYKTRAWSYDEFPSDFLAALAAGTSLTFDDLAAYASFTEWAAAYPTIGSMEGSLDRRKLYVGRAKELWALERTATVDFTADPIIGLIETGDLDFDLPNTNVTLKRMTVKVRRENHGVLLPGEELRWQVEVSVDGGYSWKQLPKSLTISAGESEGKVDMRVTGPTHRVRLTSYSVINCYTVLEMTMLVMRRGRQMRF